MLTFLMVPVFVLCALSINIRFQFLSDRFWNTTFEKNHVYLKISQILEGRLLSKVMAEGSRKEDVSVLSNIISPESVRYFFEANTKSFLLYANGFTPEIMVYTPLPVGDELNLNSLGNFSEKMSLHDFLASLSISGTWESDIKAVSRFGVLSWGLIVISFFLFSLLLFLGYLLTDHGKRFTVLGISLALSGMTLLILSFIGSYVSSQLVQNFQDSSNFGALIMTIITPPLMKNVSQIWIWFGVSAIVLGTILFFVRKPVNNKVRQ